MIESHPAISLELISELRDPIRWTSLQISVDGVKLQTSDSSRSWKIVDGIPRFVTDEHLENFGHQWTRFDVAHDAEDRATFEVKTGFLLSDLHVK